MKRELAVVINNDNKNCTIEQCIDAVVKAGYKKVFVQWYDKEVVPPQREQVFLCQKAGLEIEFAHLGYQGINNLWLPGEEGDALVQRYIQNLKDMAQLHIPMVVMHLSSKFNNPTANEIGLKRIQKIVEAAEQLKIKIAFENTKTLNQLYYILNHIPSEYVGLCFDCGHWHCNNKDNWNPVDFKGRVFAVHLHDNDGGDDQHLLPFDGNINWPKVAQMLKDCGYEGPITMELCYRRNYLSITPQQFYQESIKRGKALSELF